MCCTIYSSVCIRVYMASKSDKVTSSPLSGAKIKCGNKEALFFPSKLYI